jgi:hypothetical protein
MENTAASAATTPLPDVPDADRRRGYQLRATGLLGLLEGFVAVLDRDPSCPESVGHRTWWITRDR